MNRQIRLKPLAAGILSLSLLTVMAGAANEGKAAATTVMPMISASMYLAQFLSPFLLSLVSGIGSAPVKLPYYLAAAVSAVYFIFSLFTKSAGQV